MSRTTRWAVAVVAVMLAAQAGRLSGQSTGEWRAYGADKGSSRYSPLTEINRDNARSLRVVWRQSVIPPELKALVPPDARIPNISQNTPLMIGGLLYVATSLGTAAALDPESGKVVWFDTPPAREPGTALRAPTRGVAYWSDGTDSRIIAISGQYLVALNAKTGKRYPDFGAEGTGDVNLAKGYDRSAPGFRWGGPPLVVRDVIVIGGLGGSPGENTGRQRGNQGDIRGYDVRTGKQVWTFARCRAPASSASDTWQKTRRRIPARRRVGPAGRRRGARLRLCADRDADGNFWGGARPGNNLFAESLSASTRTPASASGISRRCITASGTTTSTRRRR